MSEIQSKSWVPSTCLLAWSRKRIQITRRTHSWESQQLFLTKKIEPYCSFERFPVKYFTRIHFSIQSQAFLVATAVIIFLHSAVFNFLFKDRSGLPPPKGKKEWTDLKTLTYKVTDFQILIIFVHRWVPLYIQCEASFMLMMNSPNPVDIQRPNFR